MANETVFKRYEGNPIITASAVPRANSIHNSAIVPYLDGYAGIFRNPGDKEGLQFLLVYLAVDGKAVPPLYPADVGAVFLPPRGEYLEAVETDRYLRGRHLISCRG